MRSNHPSFATEPFGEVIHAYSRNQAITDGELIDVSETAQEAGFRCPVALTRAVWADCVAWSEADTRHKGIPQDQSGRLWDVVWMAYLAIFRQRALGESRAVFSLYRVPRQGRGIKARLTRLKVLAGPGDAGELVLTVMLPEED